MELERYEKWEPVEGITTPAGYALVNEDQEGLSVTLIFSEIVGGLNTDIQIHFSGVAAYTVHEEFVHPWNTYDSEPLPKLEGTWKGWSFPLLVVKNSVWLRSFSEHQLIDRPDSVHYRFVSLGSTVDVLCGGLPEVSWIKPQPRVMVNDSV